MSKSVPSMEPTLDAISRYDQDWFNMAMSITKSDEHESKELVQLMYMKMFDRFNDIDKPMKSVTSLYIYKAIRNIFYSRCTKKKYELGVDFADIADEDSKKDRKLKAEFARYQMEYGEEEAEQADTLEDRKMVSDALGEVPYVDREVLLQHQEKSQRQLQKETGVCRDRLRMYKNRGLEKLEQVLKNKI